MDRHVSGQRPDVQGPVPQHGQDDFGNEALFLVHETYQENHRNYQTDSGVSRDTEISLSGAFDKVMISKEGKSCGRVGSEAPHSSKIAASEEDNSADEASVSNRLSGDADDLATARNLSTSNGSLKPFPLDGLDCSSTSMRKAYHAPHLFFSPSSTELEVSRNVDASGEPQENLGHVDTCSYVNQNSYEEQSTSGLHERTFLSSPISSYSEDAYCAYPSNQASSFILEPSNSLSDLSGDYQSYISSLQYGQLCYNYALAAQVPQTSLPFVSELPGKSQWDVVRRSFQHRHAASSQINTNGLVPGQPFYPANQVIQITPFGVEEMWKTRGTGTYFPNPSTVIVLHFVWICILLHLDKENCTTGCPDWYIRLKEGTMWYHISGSIFHSLSFQHVLAIHSDFV